MQRKQHVLQYISKHSATDGPQTSATEDTTFSPTNSHSLLTVICWIQHSKTFILKHLLGCAQHCQTYNHYVAFIIQIQLLDLLRFCHTKSCTTNSLLEFGTKMTRTALIPSLWANCRDSWTWYAQQRRPAAQPAWERVWLSTQRSVLLTCHLGRGSGRFPPTNLLYRRSTSPPSANGLFQFLAPPSDICSIARDIGTAS